MINEELSKEIKEHGVVIKEQGNIIKEQSIQIKEINNKIKKIRSNFVSLAVGIKNAVDNLDLWYNLWYPKYCDNLGLIYFYFYYILFIFLRIK